MDNKPAQKPEERHIEWVIERLNRADVNMHNSHAIAPNSFGAGYDLGFREALREVLDMLSSTITNKE